MVFRKVQQLSYCELYCMEFTLGFTSGFTQEASSSSAGVACACGVLDQVPRRPAIEQITPLRSQKTPWYQSRLLRQQQWQLYSNLFLHYGETRCNQEQWQTSSNSSELSLLNILRFSFPRVNEISLRTRSMWCSTLLRAAEEGSWSPIYSTLNGSNVLDAAKPSGCGVGMKSASPNPDQ